ncbi:unnamed protein product [Caenorhabditis brenneri]
MQKSNVVFCLGIAIHLWNHTTLPSSSMIGRVNSLFEYKTSVAVTLFRMTHLTTLCPTKMRALTLILLSMALAEQILPINFQEIIKET